MWLSSLLAKEKTLPSAKQGSVSGAVGGKVEIDSSSQHRDVSIVAPFGVAYVPPKGERTVVVPFEGGEACVGVVASLPHKLQAGEIMLFSAGGASLVLKNDGKVYINGREV